MKLYELAKTIRSKNAGPFLLTIDILFDTSAAYEQALRSGALTREALAEIYDVPLDKMRCYLLPLANAIKFSFPRKAPSGDFCDQDVYGAQFHGPLVLLDLSA